MSIKHGDEDVREEEFQDPEPYNPQNSRITPSKEFGKIHLQLSD